MSRYNRDMAYTKSRMERETVIRRAADEDEWEVFTEDPRVARRIARLYGRGQPKGEGEVWRLPPTGISFRKPRPMDDSQKAALAAQLARCRNGS